MAILLIQVVVKNGSTYRPSEVIAAFPSDYIFCGNERVEAGYFYHIDVTDKTVDEVDAYLQMWRHDPTVTQIQVDGNDRRIEVVSSMVSVSGKNAFQQVQVDALLADIGGVYVDHDASSFKFDITATLEEKDQIIERINETTRTIQYAKRRWAATQTAMDFLAANNGVASGTATEVLPFLRDGLLD